MKKILIALDYNPTAQKVAEIGYAVGLHQQASITLLHVINNPAYYSSTVFDPIMGFGGYANLDLMGPDSVQLLKNTSLEFLSKVTRHLGDDSIETLVEEGSVGETILDVAKTLHADVIVMGSHSKRWLENILMGSITEYILHRSLVPMLIIPTKKNSYK